MAAPVPGTYPPYYDNYISLVNEEDVLTALEQQQSFIDHFFNSIDEHKAGYAYAPGKWTLKQLLQHLIDSERIFSYRALTFARKDAASLPGFEENDYAEVSNANVRQWSALCKEMKAVRQSTIALFESFSAENMLSSGIANENPITVVALGYAIAGHVYHHKRIIEERYL